jgi:hypothetical protein
MNEIITFGQGYKMSSNIAIFVKSAKRYCDRLTVIGSNLDKSTIDFFNEQGVNYISDTEISNRFKIQTTLSPYTLKVIYFYLYLKYYTTSTNTFLCDFTDVFFQKNPFNLILCNNTVYVTSENHLIGQCQTNSTWLNLCYNSDVLHLLAKHNIVNGGIIFGNRKHCTNLLGEMCIDMSEIISRIGNYQNIDQASLNKCVYFDKERYTILENYEIFNLAHFSDATLNIGKEYRINNKVPYVIHQYDVLKQLETSLQKEFYE